MNAADEGRLDFPIDVGAVAERSRVYRVRCDCWQQRACVEPLAFGEQSLEMVGRLSAVVAAEISRALEGWLDRRDVHDELADGELSSDPECAVSCALLAIERSRQAWLTLVESRQVRAIHAAPFVTDLVWLKYELGRAFPDVAV